MQSVRPFSAVKPVCSRRALVVVAVQPVKGKVVSVAMDKTVTVSVERFRADPTYQKRIRVTKRYHAHDEAMTAKLGDFVLLKGSRPLSRTKRFTVAEVLRKAE